jgi:S-formylglutathione hydrolase FrmB
MTIATVQFHSQALQQPVHYTIILPEMGSGPYPVLLQLHGHGDNYQSWLHYTKLAYYARETPMIIVMPDGGTSFYLNLDEPASFRKWHSQQYEHFLIQDLRQHISNTYHAQAGRWAIGGNSMGGYGAMRLGCKYPHLFASIRAHSGTYYSADELEEVVPDHEDADVFATVTKLASSDQRHTVNIVFDCGKDDVSIEYSRQLHTHMLQLELSHQYLEQAGDHSWDYWDRQLPHALEQHIQVFQSSL